MSSSSLSSSSSSSPTPSPSPEAQKHLFVSWSQKNDANGIFCSNLKHETDWAAITKSSGSLIYCPVLQPLPSHTPPSAPPRPSPPINKDTECNGFAAKIVFEMSLIIESWEYEAKLQGPILEWVERCGYELIYFVTNFAQPKAFFLYKCVVGLI